MSYLNGWVKLGTEYDMLSDLWNQCPVLDYQDGGIGKVQWLNVTHNRAAILASDGTWQTGGFFHLWISAGAGTQPYEVKLQTGQQIPVVAGDSSGWEDAKEDAVVWAQRVLGATHW